MTVRWSRDADGHDLLLRAAAEVVGVDARAVALRQVCPTCGGPHGRPQVDVDGSPGPSVSLTHAGGMAAVAVADAPVGIDLEPVDRVGADIEDVVLSGRERATWTGVAAADRPMALLRTWVRKEAILKATGEGLAIDPRLVELGSPVAPPTLVRWPVPEQAPAVQLVDLDLGPRYLATVAVLTTADLEVEVSEAR